MDVNTSTATPGGSTDHTSSTSLMTWFQTKSETLYAVSANTPHASTALFSPSTQIMVNYTPTTLEEYQNDIRTRIQSAKHGSVSWRDVVEVYDSDDKSQKQEGTGLVAGVYVVTRSLNFRIRAAPAQRKTTVVFSA
ncbi:hypothetical protein C0992_008541, partial [Termitomyces sp. T32_za158]